MKRISSLTVLLLFAIFTYSQYITRGPDVGEIYFTGPTYTDYGLYYSTDFGQTAVCVDSISYIWSIAGDSASGGIYYFTQPHALYYSDNYGYYNSWVFKNSNVTSNINCGVNSGHISSSAGRHSVDYGENFYTNSCNGCFGNGKISVFDNVNENIGYLIATKVTVADTNYLFRSYDKFENADLIYRLEYHWSEILALARGNFSGEVFMFNFTRNNLWFTDNYFDSLYYVDTFNIQNFGIVGLEGDNQTGGLYLMYGYTNQMQGDRHLYIFHSSDYGQSFDVYHPFAKGNQPLLTNFSALNKFPHVSTPVEFDNFSIGDIEEYQWDFENDGIIDSYEECPVHIYENAGWYSVSLTVSGGDSSNSFIKENYIHVIDTLTFVSASNNSINVKISPNPFADCLTIQLGNEFPEEISIFNNGGILIRELIVNNKYCSWNGRDQNDSKCLPGIYYIKVENSIHKVLLTH